MTLVAAIGLQPGLLTATPSAAAQLPVDVQSLVDQYAAAIATAQSGRGSVESAFALVDRLRDVLMLESRAAGTVLESLDDSTFARLGRALPGVALNRQEVLVVDADVDYYATLAAAHGDPADRAFFSTLKATYPDSVWPAYIQQQTDATGCTEFGTPALVDAYRAWTAFQARFPGRYALRTRTEIGSVTAALTRSTCACGNAASVQAGLQRFVDAFPSSPLTSQVRDRLRAVRAGASNVRFSCVSG